VSLNAFIEKFNGMTEPYFFYNGSIELRYEPKGHVYYRIIDGEFVPQDGVTTVVHIIDKSDALIPWGCKQMATKLLATTPFMQLPTGDKVVPQMKYEDYEKIVLESKNAHKEKLDEAAQVGHEAHGWIEQYIKAVLSDNESRKLELLAKFPEDERARNCCLAALEWMAKHNVRWICTERKIYSRSHQYAGTMDGKAWVDSCDDSLCCPHAFKDRRSVIDWKSSNYLYLEYALQVAAYKYADEEELHERIEDIWIIRLGKDDAEFDPWHLQDQTFIDLAFRGFVLALDLHRKVRDIKAILRDRSDQIKAEMKARAQKARQEALKIKCKGADKYKGVRPPRCNGGNPCQSCLTTYQQKQQERT
jgi:hypothetical protein